MRERKAIVVRRLEPLADRVVVRPTEQEETSKGGIVLPDTAKERPQEGEVVAVGPGKIADDGHLVPMELKVGDRVVYSRYGGTEFKEDDEELLIMRESEILAKISK
jgi:chaperonin GroES